MPWRAQTRAQVIAQVRALRVPAADADVGVVALGEDPAVAAGDVAHLEQRDVLLDAGADGVVGDVGLERRGEDAVLAELERAAADAVGAVGRDEDLRARARAVVERDDRAAVLGELDGAQRTPSRKSAPASAACSARNASSRLRCVISTTGARPPCSNAPSSGWRKPIVVIWRSTTGPIANGSSRSAAQRDAAAARLVAGEARAVDEQRPHALAGEQMRGQRARRARADHDDVEALHDRSVRSRHGRQQRSSRGCRRPAGAPGHDRAAEVGAARRQRGRGADPVREPQEPPPARRRRRPLRGPRAARRRARRGAGRGAAAPARAPRLPDDRPRRRASRRRCRWRATRSRTGSSWSATRAGSRACSASTSATATSAWTSADDGSPPQRADARRLPAARGVPAPGARRGRARGRHGGSPTASSRSAATGSPTRCARAGCATATASRCSRRTRRRSSRRTTRCRSPAASSSPSTRASRRPRSAHILRHSGARVLLVDHALAPLVEPLELSGCRRRAHRRHRPARRPLRAAARLGRARAARVAGSSTRRSRSRSTTRRARPARPRASSTRTAART